MSCGQITDGEYGLRQGRGWSLHASPSELRALTELDQELFFDPRLVVNAYGRSGMLLTAINPTEFDGCRRSQEEFWRFWAEEKYPSDDFLRGFCQGAVESQGVTS